MRYGILKKLKEAQAFVSGEELAADAGVTRAALWKHLKAMKEEGARIDSVTGRGYRLHTPPDVPRAEYVKAYMSADAEVFFEDSTGSTNEDAKAAALVSGIERAVFISGQQTQGKGRKGRSWVSPPGGLYMSFLVRPDIEPDKVPGLTLMASVKFCEALEQETGTSAHIKWPNDILIGGKKAAGILTESMIGMDGVEYVVCGIGINVSTRFEGELKKKAYSVDTNRTLLAAEAADRFFEGYDTFLAEGLKPFMPEFRRRNAISGQVTVISPRGNETGGFAGFDDTGAILLSIDGQEKRYVAGEVSLRGDGVYV